MMFRLDVPTARGVVLNGVLFRAQKGKNTDTVMIAITGIHGNFYSNPFYYNIGDTLNAGRIDFIYTQTIDAFGRIETVNANIRKKEIIGSWNERFSYTDEGIDAYLTFAKREGYEHIILVGHSIGANKVIYYLSRHHDPRVKHFFLLSPANLTYMMSEVTDREKQMIKEQIESGDGDKMLPFPFMGWVECIANTAYDWQFSGFLNNVHTARNGDCSQAEKVTHNSALLVGTYENFTDGDPSEYSGSLVKTTVWKTIVNQHFSRKHFLFSLRQGESWRGRWGSGGRGGGDFLLAL